MIEDTGAACEIEGDMGRFVGGRLMADLDSGSTLCAAPLAWALGSDLTGRQTDARWYKWKVSICGIT